VGVLPLNLQAIEVDFYAFTGHKWWCGAVGVGGLYIRPEILVQAIPTFSGWRGVLSANLTDIDWRSDGQKFEVASSAYPLYGALKLAIALANQWGNQTQRYERICELSAYLWQGLDQIPQATCIKKSPPDSGLVAFKINGQSSAKVAYDLEVEHRILMRSIPDPDCLRVSLHYLSTITEIDHLIEILKKY
jgi:L-cysteine/cystine lyase